MRILITLAIVAISMFGHGCRSSSEFVNDTRFVNTYTGEKYSPCVSIEGIETVSEVDSVATPIGADSAIISKITYPALAIRAGIDGPVRIQFNIDESGVTDSVLIFRGIGAGCDDQAWNAVRNTVFKPAIKGGKPVKAAMKIHFLYKLKCNNQ